MPPPPPPPPRIYLGHSMSMWGSYVRGVPLLLFIVAFESLSGYKLSYAYSQS